MKREQQQIVLLISNQKTKTLCEFIYLFFFYTIKIYFKYRRRWSLNFISGLQL